MKTDRNVGSKLMKEEVKQIPFYVVDWTNKCNYNFSVFNIKKRIISTEIYMNVYKGM